MNKKTKFLSSILCGGLLASTLSLASVQAAPANVQVALANVQVAPANAYKNLNNSFAKVITAKDKYSIICVLNDNTGNALNRYFLKTPSPTVSGVKDILIQNNIPRSTVDKIASSVYSVINASRNQNGTADPFEIEKRGEVAVLQSQKYPELFTLSDWSSSVNSYSDYVRIPASDVRTIKNELLRTGGHVDIYQFLLQSGICSDSDRAEHITTALCNSSWQNVVSDSEDLLVLAANYGRNSAYVLVRVPR